MQKSFGEKESITRDMIYHVEFYKITDMDSYIYNAYQKQREAMFQIGFKQVLCSSLFAVLHSIITLCGKVILLLFIYPIRLTGMITAGVLAAFPIVYDNLILQIEGIRTVILGVPKQIVPIERFCEVNVKADKTIYSKEELHQKDAVVIFKNVDLRLNESHILHEVNLKIDKGEKIVIIGRNGSGKSVLLRTMLGMYDENITGEIFHSIEKLKTDVSFIPTRHQLFNGSALENIYSSRAFADEELLEDMYLYRDVKLFEDKTKDELSEGQKQMVNILRAGYKKSSILFGDEILSSLDPDKRYEVMKELVHTFDTVICISHYNEYIHLFDRVILMREGRIVEDGEVDKIKKTEAYFEWTKE